ncbi:MAG: hypothetical protein BGO43_11500 [Gammaproteobacteria bacterium 39-13]|nr:MAG: hypothetical protein BGO43_11500 [Gammaproteobacteria bacterium 39-13]
MSHNFLDVIWLINIAKMRNKFSNFLFKMMSVIKNRIDGTSFEFFKQSVFDKIDEILAMRSIDIKSTG